MNENTSIINPRNIITAVLIVLLGAMYLSLSYNGVFFPPDEGAILYHFEKSAEGAVQHRDFYSVYGAAFYIMGKWLFQLFGFRVMTTRMFVLLLKLVMAVLTYFIALGVMRRGFAFLSALGFIVWWADPFVATPMYLYPAHLSQLLGLLSVLFLLIYCRNGRKVFVLCAGLAAGFNCLFKPNVGAFNIIALFFFFFARGMLMDLQGIPGQSSEEQPRRGAPLGTFWILLELCAVAGAAILLSVAIGKFGIEIPVFIVFLVPIYIIVGYLMILVFKTVRATNKERRVWNNSLDTFSEYVLVGCGFVFFQLMQIAYFISKGALDDFLHMLDTATTYYNNYAIPFPGGMSTVCIVGIAALVVMVFYVLMRATVSAAGRWKLLVTAGGMIVSALPVLIIFLRLENVVRLHFIMWMASLVFSILVSLYLASRDSLKGEGKNLVVALSALLISFYAALNLLDAYPKVDLGHFFMIMPPVFILFGFLAQRLYDSWNDYLQGTFLRASHAVGVTITGLIALGVFLPSLFMMFMFQIFIIPSANGHFRLHNEKFSLVPHYSPGLERTDGLKIHVLDDAYWPPLAKPETKDFFAVAKRISEITRPDEKVFSTMSSGLMLLFLADRDSIGDKANCYVFQTVTGVTTSDALTDFSDAELAEIIEREHPGAIIAEKESAETRRFMVNFPATWSLLTTRYHRLENVGPYQIYAPD